MRRRAFPSVALANLVFGCWLSACAHLPASEAPNSEVPIDDPQLLARFAAGLGCPPQKVTADVWPGEALAEGCGRLAAFRAGADGSWGLEGRAVALSSDDPVPFRKSMTPPTPIEGLGLREIGDALVKTGVRSGTFVGSCIVNRKGEPSGCEVLQSMPGGDETILKIIRQWRFKPALYRGQAITTFYGMTLKLTPQQTP